MFSVIALFLGVAVSLLPNLSKAEVNHSQDIQFFTKQSDVRRMVNFDELSFGEQLYARIGEDLFTIDHDEWENQLFKEIILQADLDHDGFLEVFLRVETGSGCCGADLYIVSHREDGFFSVQTSRYFKNFRDVSLIEKEGRKLIKVWQDEADIFGTSWEQSIGIFSFTDGQLKKLSHSKNMAKSAPLVEMTSASLQLLPERYGERRLRIDSDNWLDTVSCQLSYIERFLDCTVKFAAGGQFRSPRNCKRFAVLETSNYGVRDLGCNRTQKGEFDGERYVWQP